MSKWNSLEVWNKMKLIIVCYLVDLVAIQIQKTLAISKIMCNVQV